jgi:hypothetical protein
MNLPNRHLQPVVRVVDKGDRFVWVLDGDVLHRDGDLPAVVHRDGTQEFYMFGLRHRERGRPAYIGADGTKAWCRAGQYYRPNGLPAIEYAGGGKVGVVYNQDDTHCDTSWWLGCLAFVVLLITALVAGRSAVLAACSAVRAARLIE